MSTKIVFLHFIRLLIWKEESLNLTQNTPSSDRVNNSHSNIYYTITLSPSRNVNSNFPSV